jgi:opacity protein-like surface antigen
MRRQPLTALRPTLAGILVALLVPVGAAAQPPAKRPALPRLDVAGYVTWMGGQGHDLPDSVYRDWDAAAGGALSAGFYWTEHLKVELDAERTGEREVYGSFAFESPRNTSRYRYDSYYIGSHSLTLSTNYQYLHNTWVHPYVGIGLEMEWERTRKESEIRSYTTTPPYGSSVEELPDEITRSWHARPALSTGAKFYVSPRVFLRTDVRVSFGSRADAVRWRVGGGIDF